MAPIISRSNTSGPGDSNVCRTCHGDEHATLSRIRQLLVRDRALKRGLCLVIPREHQLGRVPRGRVVVAHNCLFECLTNHRVDQVIARLAHLSRWCMVQQRTQLVEGIGLPGVGLHNAQQFRECGIRAGFVSARILHESKQSNSQAQPRDPPPAGSTFGARGIRTHHLPWPILFVPSISVAPLLTGNLIPHGYGWGAIPDTTELPLDAQATASRSVMM